MIVIFILLWCIIGVASVMWDWTRKLDLRVDDVPVLIFFGCSVGPILGVMNLLGWVFQTILIKTIVDKDKILIKRRVK